ncbi:hypothetical protein BD310DRAFT_379256 [Dichomitus squalens]|uniref:Uncharacterized protein n=1 Tax=Dichomitus squalens TaxID=114155 RepID=A0A4Q9PYM9_9APHY|nr:hypothetical protein BD310DRAFT_379256 [Dichomitus squalens]
MAVIRAYSCRAEMEGCRRCSIATMPARIGTLSPISVLFPPKTSAIRLRKRCHARRGQLPSPDSGDTRILGDARDDRSISALLRRSQRSDMLCSKLKPRAGHLGMTGVRYFWSMHPVTALNVFDRSREISFSTSQRRLSIWHSVDHIQRQECKACHKS